MKLINRRFETVNPKKVTTRYKLWQDIVLDSTVNYTWSPFTCFSFFFSLFVPSLILLAPLMKSLFPGLLFFCLSQHHQLFLPAGSSTFTTSVEKKGDTICSRELRGPTAADGWVRRRGAGGISPGYMSQTQCNTTNDKNIIHW